MIVDGRGRAIGFALAPGQVHELLHELPMGAGLPGWIIGDRSLACNSLRERIWDMGARPVIVPRRTDTPLTCPDWICANRRFVENLWARLKEWCA